MPPNVPTFKFTQLMYQLPGPLLTEDNRVGGLLQFYFDKEVEDPLPFYISYDEQLNSGPFSRGDYYSNFVNSQNYPVFEKQSRAVFNGLIEWSKQNLPNVSSDRWATFRDEYFFARAWVIGFDVYSVYSTIKRLLEDLLLLLITPDEPGKPSRLIFKQRAMASILSVPPIDNPLTGCSPGVVVRLTKIVGALTSHPLYQWKYNVIENRAILYARKFLATTVYKDDAMNVHYTAYYISTLEQGFALTLPQDSFIKRISKIEYPRPYDSSIFRAEVMSEITVENLLSNLVGDALTEVKNIIGSQLQPNFKDITYEQLESVRAQLEAILSPFGEDNLFGLKYVVDIVSKGDEGPFTLIPKTHAEIQAALYSTLCTRVMNGGFVEIPNVQPGETIKNIMLKGNNEVIGIVKKTEDAWKVSFFDCSELTKTFSHLLDDVLIKMVQEDPCIIVHAKKQGQSWEVKLLTWEEFSAEYQLKEYQNDAGGILGTIKTELLKRKEPRPFLPSKLEPILRANVPGSIIPFAAISSGSWQASLQHLERQAERGGVLLGKQKTKYASQKLALFNFLELVAGARYVVRGDFWLEIEAQASYFGTEVDSTQYLCLGAFDKSWRHSSQTIDGYKEVKRAWEASFCAIAKEKPLFRTKGLEVKIPQEKWSEVEKKINVHITKLGDLLSKSNSSEEKSSSQESLRKTGSFFAWSSPSLTDDAREKLTEQKTILEGYRDYFSAENAVGTNAEQFLLDRQNLIESGASKAILETFEELYALWHDQAVVAMQEKIGLPKVEEKERVTMSSLKIK